MATALQAAARRSDRGLRHTIEAALRKGIFLFDPLNNTKRRRAIQSFMLQFVCDYCRNIKEPGEVWINGIAAENVGTRAARREVIVDSVWRYERAVEPFAVHFCSIECKDNYMAELFREPPGRLEIEQVEVLPAAGARVVHARGKAISITSGKRKTMTTRKPRRR